MKLIHFKSYGPFDTRAVIKQVTNVKVGGMLLDEMRKRVSLAKKFDDDKAKHVIVDDEEFKLIEQGMKTTPFSGAHEELLNLIDDVLSSKEPPVVMLRDAKPEKGKKAALPA